MNKRVKKLALAKETLQGLQRLEGVVGGSATATQYCAGTQYCYGTGGCYSVTVFMDNPETGCKTD